MAQAWVRVTIGLVLWLAAAGEVNAFEAGVNRIEFAPVEARFVRLVIVQSRGGQPCIDELEVYGAEGENVALASKGAKASASSCLAGYAIHQVAHLNDGLYGNGHSWIAAGWRDEWAQIELARPAVVSAVVFSRDRQGHFSDRLAAAVEVRVSLDGQEWRTVVRSSMFPMLPEGEAGHAELLRYAFECEKFTWGRYDRSEPVKRVLGQMEEMIERFAMQGVDVGSERRQAAEFRRAEAGCETTLEREELFLRARLAKRRLLFRAPELRKLDRVLFVKRHPYEPSHNYSVILDAAGGPGGGIFVLEAPRRGDACDADSATVRKLLDAGEGIIRDPAADFGAERIWFAWRRSMDDYYRLYAMDSDGGGVVQMTEGPFHDYFPCPLPDGGISFISTRCRARFLCWRPQAFVLFRMDADGGNIRALSHANLSEWTPAMMRDGRIIWMRSEYVDKGADFGHTLWAIRPDGTHPELIFGNNTLNCYANGREVPDSREILCTLVSHGGDLNGPIALIDPSKGRFNPEAITNITPDVEPHYHMSWAREQCFRDPYPIGRDYYLCSHAAMDRFGLYVIDRYGNREMLYLDPEMGSMSPSLLRVETAPPVLGESERPQEEAAPEGEFFVADVYEGLGANVKRGTVKYIRVCQELRADLIRLPGGEYQADHEPFEDWYASPTHKVRGPHGWPSYVAKADLGTAPVEEDGSARFRAPAGKVLYFQALDKDFNEIQRMRSVVQLQAGETRGCVGCHENRLSTPRTGGVVPRAMRVGARRLEAPPWGAGAFSYEKVVQPVWDAKCISCHNAGDDRGIDLSGTPDGDGIPASYRTVITRGWVHYFDYTWQQRHSKAEPLTFGTVRSGLWEVLDGGHYDVELTEEERRRIKLWTDLNCPLWPDYVFRPSRMAAGGVHRP